MNGTKGLVIPPGGGTHLDMSAPGRFSALKLLGRETNESVMLFEETVPAGTKSLFHLHHDSDEVAWVLAGEITFKIGDDVSAGGPGTCAFFPRDVPHASKNTGRETARVLFLYTPAAAGGYVEALLQRRGPNERRREQGAPRALPLGNRRPQPALTDRLYSGKQPMDGWRLSRRAGVDLPGAMAVRRADPVNTNSDELTVLDRYSQDCLAAVWQDRSSPR
jgi:quercetin dioxygenase-like cupin family protein